MREERLTAKPQPRQPQRWTDPTPQSVGIIPKVDHPTPAFIHVDIDDLWAIGECYGYKVAARWAQHVSTDALPRFRKLFAEQGLKATFFMVGRDLESPRYVENIQGLLADGHRAANHSYSHSLRFRTLPATEMAAEIDQCHAMAQSALHVDFHGFRAPGYAWSPQLLELLDARGYRYDASLMPGPYGGIFRYLDSRMQQTGGSSAAQKTQYPLFSDTWNSLYPAPVGGSRLIEIPSATAPFLRLPFQAGVCMRLGWPYFRACFEPYRWNQALPFVFLFHAADLADFLDVPHDLFRRSPFFNKPIEDRLQLARRFLQTIQTHRPIITTEDWLE